VRLRALPLALMALAGCREIDQPRAPEDRAMVNEPPDVVFGPAALKAWAEISAEDRAQAKAVFAAQGAPAPTLSIVVLDGSLPPGFAATIVPDPTANGKRLLLFSRSSYNDAAFAMVTQILGNARMASVPNTSDGFHMMANGTVLDAELRPVFELTLPETALTKTSETLDHLIAVATSAESIVLPKFGPGKIYRFN
jgi:hypothetical protein